MSLIEKLREAAGSLPPSQIPSPGEVAGVVGAAIAAGEHGQSFFDAAEKGAEEVAALFAPAVEDVVKTEAGPELAVAEDVAPAVEKVAEQIDPSLVNELRRQLDEARTELANLRHGQITVEHPADEPEPAA